MIIDTRIYTDFLANWRSFRVREIANRPGQADILDLPGPSTIPRMRHIE
jgi:hypothetical protein